MRGDRAVAGFSAIRQGVVGLFVVHRRHFGLIILTLVWAVLEQRQHVLLTPSRRRFDRRRGLGFGLKIGGQLGNLQCRYRFVFQLFPHAWYIDC
ncbi:hypothetical protein D3C78_949730 [compost metagenome]